MVFTTLHKQVFVFHEGRYELPAPSQCENKMEDAKYFPPNQSSAYMFQSSP